MMIFSGPEGPKFIAETLVASEKVGEGGPLEELSLLALVDTVSVRRDRVPGILTLCNVG